MRKWIISGIIVLAGCRTEPEAVAPLYDTAAVQQRSIEISVDAAGVIEPETTVEVKSKASGEILAVHAQTGDIVAAGTLLVEVDKRTPRNRLAEVEAALVAARARRTIGETQMKRAATLFESATLTQADYEQTQLEFANAEAQVVSSEVAVENARIAMEDTEVRAPITGTIIAKAVEPGMVITSPTNDVSGGTVLMQMADLNAVQVRTLVDETDIGKIQPNMPAEVTVAAYPNQPFTGTVLKIEPLAILEQNVTMFAVLIRLENHDGLLKPGMNAEVQIQIASREDVPSLPTAALRTDSDIPATAAMLGIDEAELRSMIKGADAAPGPASGNALELAGRRIELPEGVDAARVQALIEKRRSGGTLTEEERALLQPLMQQVFTGGAGGGPSGGGVRAGGLPGGGVPAGGFPGGAFPSGGFPGAVFFGGPNADGPPANRPSVTQYQFGGEYWVIAMRGNRLEAVTVQTGLTDLAYTEVVAGLESGDEVLLLPSTSLFEQQAQLRQFISQRFSSTPFQQQQSGGLRFR
jgi:HlyD family secretion protein